MPKQAKESEVPKAKSFRLRRTLCGHEECTPNPRILRVLKKDTPQICTSCACRERVHPKMDLRRQQIFIAVDGTECRGVLLFLFLICADTGSRCGPDQRATWEVAAETDKDAGATERWGWKASPHPKLLPQIHAPHFCMHFQTFSLHNRSGTSVVVVTRFSDFTIDSTATRKEHSLAPSLPFV